MRVADAQREIRTAHLGGFAGGLVLGLYLTHTFSLGAWLTGAVLLLFAAIARAAVRRELREAEAA